MHVWSSEGVDFFIIKMMIIVLSKFNEDFGYEKKPREDSHSFGYKSAFAKVRSDHSAVARLKF